MEISGIGRRCRRGLEKEGRKKGGGEAEAGFWANDHMRVFVGKGRKEGKKGASSTIFHTIRRKRKEKGGVQGASPTILQIPFFSPFFFSSSEGRRERGERGGEGEREEFIVSYSFTPLFLLLTSPQKKPFFSSSSLLTRRTSPGKEEERKRRGGKWGGADAPFFILSVPALRGGKRWGKKRGEGGRKKKEATLFVLFKNPAIRGGMSARHSEEEKERLLQLSSKEKKKKRIQFSDHSNNRG